MKVNEIFTHKHSAVWWTRKIPDRNVKSCVKSHLNLLSKSKKYSNLHNLFDELYEKTGYALYYIERRKEYYLQDNDLIRTLIHIFYKIDYFFIDLFKK